MAIPRRSFVPAAGVFLTLAVFGGSSRADEIVQIPNHIFAVFFGTWALLVGGTNPVGRTKAPTLLIAALAAICFLQLVPLPPDLWIALPHNKNYAEFARAASVATVWRPLSVSPDATLSILFGLIPPFAALLALRCLPQDDSRTLVRLALGIIAIGALAGIVQLAGGGREALYIAELSSAPVPGGFLSNRNHFALLLALGLLLLAAYARLEARSADSARLSTARALLVALFATILVVLIFSTGSRSGLALGCVAILGSGAILYPQRRDGHGLQASRKFKLAALLVCLALIGLVAVSLTESASVRRLFAIGSDSQTRSDILPVALQLVRNFFPFGTGMGAFVESFQEIEPHHMLGIDYVNHAHNDYVEFLGEGGVLALAVMLGAGWWWIGRAKVALDAMRNGGGAAVAPMTGVICTALIGIASIVDYPVRTPLFAGLLMLFLVLMNGPTGAKHRDQDSGLRR